MSSTYTAKTLIDSVIRRAKDSSLSRTLVLEFLDDAQNEATNQYLFDFCRSRYEDTISDGLNEIPLPDDCQIVDNVIIYQDETNKFSPQYVKYHEFFDAGMPDTTTDSLPSMYTIYNKTIIFNCNPDKTYNVEINYTAYPRQLDGENVIPTIPREFKNILVMSALADIEENRENFDIAAIYERKVADLTRDMRKRYALLKMPFQSRRSFRGNENI